MTTLAASLHPRDQHSFQLAVSKNMHRLRRVAQLVLGNSADAEDAVQEALLRAHRALPQFRGESTLFTWLYRITLSSASNLLRQRKRRGAIEAPSEPNDDEFGPRHENVEHATPESELATQRLHERVRLAFARLPDDQRIALELREIEGLSYEEIAARMDAPLGTIRSRIFRARERVAASIRPYADGPFREPGA